MCKCLIIDNPGTIVLLQRNLSFQRFYLSLVERMDFFHFFVSCYLV